MVRAGDTIENPLSGERIRFDLTGYETDGRYLSGRIELAPHGVGPPEHVHRLIEERFRVVSGILSARVDGADRAYQAGEEIVVPPGIPHRWWNDTGDTVEVDFHVSPALPLDRFLESVFALAQRGLTDRRGLPNPLRMSRILRRHWDVVHLARPPLLVQRVVMAMLTPVAVLLRYPTEYAYPYDPAAAGRDRAAGD